MFVVHAGLISGIWDLDTEESDVFEGTMSDMTGRGEEAAGGPLRPRTKSRRWMRSGSSSSDAGSCARDSSTSSRRSHSSVPRACSTRRRFCDSESRAQRHMEFNLIQFEENAKREEPLEQKASEKKVLTAESNQILHDPHD